MLFVFTQLVFQPISLIDIQMMLMRKLCKDNLLVRSKWDITFGYKKNVTFTPYISIQYLYPVGSDGEMAH